MRRRTGFTLVEMLVVMALIIFIMAILAAAFDSGMTAFRQLKAVGDMNEKLRSTSTILRRALSADHFEGKRRLSDPNFWNDGPPREGFFRIYHGSGGTLEGTDIDGIPSYRTSDHVLHFTTKYRGNNRGDFFRASVPAKSPTNGAASPLLSLGLPDTRFQEPGTTYTSPWAEVVVFLRQTGEMTQPPEGSGLPQLPLYTLYMRQRLLVPDNSLVAQVPWTDYSTYGQYTELSCMPDPSSANPLSPVFYFNGPPDMTQPARRLGSPTPAGAGQPGLPGPLTPGTAAQPMRLSGATLVTDYPTLSQEPTGVQAGNDVLLADVLSFDVRVRFDGFPDFVGLHDTRIDPYWNQPGTTTPNNPSFGTARVFDTWSSLADANYDYSGWATPGTQTSIPMYQSGGQPLRVRAVLITIRVWNQNTQQARQSSIVVDL